MDNFEIYTEKAIEVIVTHSPKLLLAIITLLVGLWLIKVALRVMSRRLETSQVDKTLVPFFTSLLSWSLKILLLISVASMVGIATTSFIAVLGAAGLAVGFALQGSLANFAGGALILIFKPYEVGDLIETQGHLGVVKEIQIFSTILLTPENKRVIVPNGPASNNSIVNFSAEGQLRVDLVFGVGYESNIKKAKEVLLEILCSDERVLKDPAPHVAVSELADSSVNLIARPWCKVSDYWGVYFDTVEKAKLKLEASGISIPFPQRDVHIFDQTVS